MADTEKITINMSAVELGKIDLLVQEGIYTNRTDFIRSAIRSQIEKHNMEIQQSVARHSYAIGVLVCTRSELESYVARKEKIKLSVLGLLHIKDDVSPELAAQAVEWVQVRGIFQASDAVKAVLSDRMKS